MKIGLAFAKNCLNATITIKIPGSKLFSFKKIQKTVYNIERLAATLIEDTTTVAAVQTTVFFTNPPSYPKTV